jgi:arylsulfatase A-like enzyme
LGVESPAEDYQAFWSMTDFGEIEVQPSGRLEPGPPYLSLTLKAPKGSAFTVYESTENTDAEVAYEISGTLIARGAASQGSALATLSAIEIRGEDPLPEYTQLPSRMGREWGLGQVSASRSDASLQDEPTVAVPFREVIRLTPDSRGFALAFGAMHPGLDDLEFELRFLDVERAGPEAIARAIKERGVQRDADQVSWQWAGWRYQSPTRFQLDWTNRFGWIVPPGKTMESLVTWPGGCRKARLWAGLAPHPSTDPAARIELLVSVLHPSSTEPVEARIELGPEHFDRWIPVEVELGDLQEIDELAQISISCAAQPGSSTWAAPVVAGLRGIWEDPSQAESNLLLVSLDTLRADHVGGYGYERDTTPRLDDFARQALRFTNVWSTSAYTLPAHLSMLSGQLPSLHGVERPEQRRSPLTTPLLAEQLAAEGYATAAFTGGAMLLPDFGFASGFERYGILDPSITPEAEEVIERLLPVPGFDRETVARHGLQPALDWVDEHRNEPWFLFVHTYAAHEFEPPPRFLRDLGLDGSIERDEAAMAFLGNQQMPDERARRYLIDRYDGGVRAADEMVGRLLDHLDERGLRDDTVILITSDHGKEIGDRNQVRHGHSLHEEMVHVPLWLSAPGLKPGVIDSPKSLIDVAPTLIELLGLPAWPAPDGPEALRPRSLLERSGDRRELWAELDNQGVTRAWRQGPRKTIHNPERPGSIEITPGPEWQGYDLDEDPFESNPLEVSADRRATLEALYGELRLAGQREGDGVNLGSQQKALLEALGYTVDGAGN